MNDLVPNNLMNTLESDMLCNLLADKPPKWD